VSDTSLRRADELLTQLVELVETARAIPMSGSCVVPREHTLDLLDDLREVLPLEIVEARRVVAERAALLAEARSEADRLVSESAVHDAAVRAADELRGQGEVDAAAVRESAERAAATAVAEAHERAAILRRDAADWAQGTLTEVVETLTRAVGVADRGRSAIAARAGAETGAEADAG
jgi:cell division septum initiation protein DivIVA